MVTGSLRKTTKSPRKDGHTGERHEYFCGTYAKYCRENRRKECSCLRNGVFQDVLEKFIDRYLEESGQRLEVLTEGLDVDHLTGKLERQEDAHWWEFMIGMERLQMYLSKHHAEEYRTIVADSHDEDATPDEFVAACIECYQAVFDPSKLSGEIERLEAEHTSMMQQWSDLPTPHAQETARERLVALEARIEALRRQQENLGEAVATHYGEMCNLRNAIDNARRAMKEEADERALRQRTEALRAIIQRIECTFTATGETGSGWGKKNARLAKVTIYPVVGDSVAFPAEPKGTLLYSSDHSRMNRTWTGRMR
jgi:hypothetical protein